MGGKPIWEMQSDVWIQDDLKSTQIRFKFILMNVASRKLIITCLVREN
jgi:hypothetical protein